ncbi:MAG: PTS sugar transporter subunit IIA [Acidobacteriota bacterium]
MDLAALLDPDLIFPGLHGKDREAVLRSVADHVAVAGRVPDAQSFFDALLEREGLGSTGIGNGVAVPHCKLKGVGEPVLAVAVTRRGIDFFAVDGEVVQVLFVLASPEKDPVQHLQVLAAISRWVRHEENLQALIDANDRSEIFELLRRERTEEPEPVP